MNDSNFKDSIQKYFSDSNEEKQSFGPIENWDFGQVTDFKEAFAVLKDDGSVVTWGKQTEGGDSSTLTTFASFVDKALLAKYSTLSDVTKIVSTNKAFAVISYSGIYAIVWEEK